MSISTKKTWTGYSNNGNTKYAEVSTNYRIRVRRKAKVVCSYSSSRCKEQSFRIEATSRTYMI